MAAGQGDLERAPADRLTTDVGEVRRLGTRLARLGRPWPAWPCSPAPPAIGPVCPSPASSIRSGGAGRFRLRRDPASRRSSTTWPRSTPVGRRPRGRGRPRRPLRTGRRSDATPRSASAATIGNMPGTARRSPPSDSSPMNAHRPLARTWSEPSRMPMAMARSSEAPALRRSAGARLTVIRRGGNARPLLRIAPRTRSRASWSAASGRPTMVNPGRPGATSTSTRMTRPSMPWSVAARTVASTPGPYRRRLTPAYQPGLIDPGLSRARRT